MGEKKIVWVTWESQRRNVSMSASIDAVLYEVIYDDSPVILRYIFSLIKTTRIIFAERPDVLVVQNPSILLSFFVVLVKITNLFKFKLVIDAHNAGVFPSNLKIIFHNKIRNFIVKNSDITIVTNENIAKFVRGLGGVPIVIEDPLPTFSNNIAKKELKGRVNFLFICSYASDEPYLELIKGVRQLGMEFYVYMTGSPNAEIVSMLDDLPENLIITGYLSAEEYDSLLFSVDAVIDLTKREDCLVCGAYEAVSAQKPLILSNKKTLKEYFGVAGIVYANNKSDDIVRCIKDIAENLESYQLEVKQLKSQLLSCWQKRKEDFFIVLNQWRLL